MYFHVTTPHTLSSKTILGYRCIHCVFLYPYLPVASFQSSRAHANTCTMPPVSQYRNESTHPHGTCYHITSLGRRCYHFVVPSMRTVTVVLDDSQSPIVRLDEDNPVARPIPFFMQPQIVLQPKIIPVARYNTPNMLHVLNT